MPLLIVVFMVPIANEVQEDMSAQSSHIDGVESSFKIRKMTGIKFNLIVHRSYLII